MPFIGREAEIKLLEEFARRKTAGLVVVCGRRRIGKSTLVEHFATGKNFYEFSGLSPREELKNSDQLAHFAEQLSLQFNLPSMNLRNWNEALTTLASLTEKKPTIILLDEISWMASKDKDFTGKLKAVWDTRFKKNSQLILFICGSVTSWIQENILQDKGYVGRVSLTLNLAEMPLYDANKFWGEEKLISTHEKFKLLCVTGGVPRYLEEINPKQTAEKNIKRLCYTPEGTLYNEFDKIFRDIFQRQENVYKNIVRQLVSGSMENNQLAETLGKQATGGLSKQLKDLVAAGFISRDFVYDFKGARLKKSKYRLSDNYIRFYLKYIEPKKDVIEKGLLTDLCLEDLPQWHTILGLQFENLVLNNLKTIIEKLSIPASTIISASPYFQANTTRQKACQIDLLIHTKHTLYVCEIKFKQKIESSVIDQMREKIKRLKYPMTVSVRPVLIYEGELAQSVQESDFFVALIQFRDLLVQM